MSKVSNIVDYHTNNNYAVPFSVTVVIACDVWGDLKINISALNFTSFRRLLSVNI